MAAHDAWNAPHRLATGELRYVGELLRDRVAPRGARAGRSRYRLADRVRTTARRFQGRPLAPASRTSARSIFARNVTTAR